MYLFATTLTSNRVQIRSRTSFSTVYFIFVNVLCFSANWTIFSSIFSPFLLLTLFMYCKAAFSLSAFSPKCSNSSSVCGSLEQNQWDTCNIVAKQWQWLRTRRGRCLLSPSGKRPVVALPGRSFVYVIRSQSQGSQ